MNKKILFPTARHRIHPSCVPEINIVYHTHGTYTACNLLLFPGFFCRSWVSSAFRT